MFHTFQSSAGQRTPAGEAEFAGKPTRSTGSRRISTSNACVECRRRKIRCDGTQPCGQCVWYQHPDVSIKFDLPQDCNRNKSMRLTIKKACSYSKPAQRVVPSRKSVYIYSSTAITRSDTLQTSRQANKQCRALQGYFDEANRQCAAGLFSEPLARRAATSCTCVARSNSRHFTFCSKRTGYVRDPHGIRRRR
jgi:hypothetical protein